jgi:hypothetical protein
LEREEYQRPRPHPARTKSERAIDSHDPLRRERYRGWSLVVGAGSVRDTGEVYTCIDESSVAEVPDWLIDWLLADSRKYRSGRDKELAEKNQKKVVALRLKAEVRSNLRRQGRPDGFDIAEEDIYDFLRWRAWSYSRLGETGDELAQSLRYQAIRFCEGGEAFANSESGQRTIRKIASEERKVGNATWFYRQSAAKVDIHHLTPPSPSKVAVIKEIMSDFPTPISKADALERIRTGLDKEGYPFDDRLDKDKLLNARRALGFEVKDGYWKRLE